LNGVLEGSNSYGTIETVTSQMQIGQTLGWPGEGFLGVLDDLRFYDRALTDTEIQTIYACKGSDSILYGLQAKWLFIGPEDGVITGSVTELSNNEFVGTAVNNPTYKSTFLKTRRYLYNN
jgi:hypothetical protein